ncbi:hypothetical protein M0R72_06545 [Candidatus Pacearchaeota archaeon]|jgi:hypothetical protein|nr:hypothetical protein [Candidatus Pacearchaeota archaeon]
MDRPFDLDLEDKLFNCEMAIEYAVANHGVDPYKFRTQLKEIFDDLRTARAELASAKKVIGEIRESAHGMLQSKTVGELHDHAEAIIKVIKEK